MEVASQEAKVLGHPFDFRPFGSIVRNTASMLMRAAALPFELHRLLSYPTRSSWHPTRPFSTSNARRFYLLSLESSADDSCAAILSSDADYTNPKILSSVVLKQPEQEQFGGIHPIEAQRSHHVNIPLAIKQALQEANMSLAEVGAIAYTRGPGMLGCLNTCGGAAKALAAAMDLPLLGVHHMQAHALTPLLTESPPPSFPFLTLLVSGGHTLLVLARSESSFKILATTHDESIGRSFDKASRALSLRWNLGAGSPGAALEQFCNFSASEPYTPLSKSNPFKVPFWGELAFSYSGLRSEFDRILRNEKVETMSEERKKQLARWYVEAAVAQVEEKVVLAVASVTAGEKLGALVMSGGVASNQFLRRRLRQKLDSMGHAELPFAFPPVHLCTDNAAMIGMVGLSRLRRGRIDDLGKQCIAKWSIEECEKDFEKA